MKLALIPVSPRPPRPLAPYPAQKNLGRSLVISNPGCKGRSLLAGALLLLYTPALRPHPRGAAARTAPGQPAWRSA